MADATEAKDERRFTIVAVRKDNPSQLIQINLPWQRLMEDIVFPYDEGEMFFIDGAAIKSDMLDRLKILLQGPSFNPLFAELNRNLRFGDIKNKELHARQYQVFFDAILRERCEDVTSQVIKAYKTAIKPSIKDYFPKREQLLDASVKIFIEGMKLLSQR